MHSKMTEINPKCLKFATKWLQSISKIKIHDTNDRIDRKCIKIHNKMTEIERKMYKIHNNMTEIDH